MRFLSSILYILCICFLPVQVFANSWTQSDIPVEKLDEGSLFIPPNEGDFHLFNPALEKTSGGALLVVGTFRAFHDASIGTFDSVYMVDISLSANRHNVSHLNLLDSVLDRYDYLEKLFATPGLTKTFKDYENGGISADQLKALLEQVVTRLKSEQPQLFQVQDEYLNYMIKFIADKLKYTSTFLGSDQAFSRLHQLVRNRQIHVVGGSLSGTKVMPWIAAQLKSRQQKVAVLDISNVFDGIYVSGSDAQFLSNLKALPFADQGQILYTVQGNSRLPWHYLHLSHRDYINKLETYNGNDSVFYPHLRTPASQGFGVKTSATIRCPDLLK